MTRAGPTADLRRNRPYSLLARFYDQVTPGCAAMNRHAREKILGKSWPEFSRVVEIACGSGATAVDLARKGLEVEAIDLSPIFVRSTRARAKAARVELRVRRGDMRDFRVARPADLVVCEFSALNNLARRDELPRVLRCVARALRPGGLFYFDVEGTRSFRSHMAATMTQEGRGFALTLRGSVVERGKVARVDCDWTIPAGPARRGPKGNVRRVRETIWHVAWTVAELRRALRAAGFGSIQSFDGVDVRPRRNGAVRGTDLYFTARKRHPGRRAAGAHDRG